MLLYPNDLNYLLNIGPTKKFVIVYYTIYCFQVQTSLASCSYNFLTQIEIMNRRIINSYGKYNVTSYLQISTLNIVVRFSQENLNSESK